MNYGPITFRLQGITSGGKHQRRHPATNVSLNPPPQKKKKHFRPGPKIRNRPAAATDPGSSPFRFHRFRCFHRTFVAQFEARAPASPVLLFGRPSAVPRTVAGPARPGSFGKEGSFPSQGILGLWGVPLVMFFFFAFPLRSFLWFGFS